MSLIASYKPISSLVKLIQPALSISIHWVPRPNRLRSIPILLTTLYRGQNPEIRLSKLRCSLVLDLTDDGEIDGRHGTLMGLSLLLINLYRLQFVYFNLIGSLLEDKGTWGRGQCHPGGVVDAVGALGSATVAAGMVEFVRA